MQNRKILITSLSWTYAYKILMQLATLVAQIILIRELVVSDYGIYSVLASFVTLVSAFTVAPMGSVIARYIPEYIELGYWNRIYKILNTVIFFTVILIVCMVGLLQIYPNFIGLIFNIDNISNIKIFVTSYVVLGMIHVVLSAVLTSCMLHDKVAKIYMVQSLWITISILALIPWLNLKLAILISGIGLLIFIFPGLYLCYSFFKNNTIQEYEHKNNPNDTSREFKYGLFSLGNEVGATAIGKTSDLIIVSALLTPFQVGLMAVGQRFYQFLYQVFPLKEFTTVFRPLMVRRFSESGVNSEMNFVVNLLIKLLIPVFSLAIIFVAICGQSFLSVVAGSNYQAAWMTMLVIFSGGITVSLFYPVGLVAIVMERMDLAMYCKLVGVFTLPLGVYAAINFGIVGVALVTLFGDFLRNYLLYFLMFKKYGLKINWAEHILLILKLSLLGILISPVNLVSNDALVVILGGVLIPFGFLVFVFLFTPLTIKEVAFLEYVLSSTSVGRKVILVFKKISILCGKIKSDA